MTKTTVEEFVSTREGQLLFQRERAIESVTDIICELMKKHGVNRSQLAKRLKMTPGRVSQILDGEGNRTLNTLSDVFVSLGHSLNFFPGTLDVRERMFSLDTGHSTAASDYAAPQWTVYVDDCIINTASSSFVVASTKKVDAVAPPVAASGKLTKAARFGDSQFERKPSANPYIQRIGQ